MRKIGVIGIPGGWSSEKLADMVERKTGFRLLVDLEQVYFDSKRQSLFFNDIDLASLDGYVIKKIGAQYSPDLLNRLELLKYLENRGVKFFSKIDSIFKSFSRLSGTLTLKLGGIPMPPTVVTEEVDKAVETVHEFRKAVLKPLFSTKARGMIVLSGEDENLKDKITSFKNSGNSNMYIQQMVPIPGKDLGIAFLGGEYLSTYARVKDPQSWNTTVNSGGRYEYYEPSKEILSLAAKAQDLFKLDFTSVDVVETPEGPMVFEVSAFGGFRGLHESKGIDAAEKYVSYVMERLKYEN